MYGGPAVARKIVVSVKGAENVGLSMVKDLTTTAAHNQAKIGLFIHFPPMEA